MKKALTSALGGLAMIAVASIATAQDVAPGEQGSVVISDANIRAYASVAAEVNKIQAEAGLSESEKNARMAAAVQDSGMDLATFNAITAAIRTDPQIRQKFNEAMPD